MKVLVISHMYPSTFNNTKGIFVHKQVKALIEQGCEVKVVSPVPLAPFPLKVLKKKWKAYADIPERAVIEGVEVFYPRYMEFPNSLFFAYSGYFMYMGIKDFIKKLHGDFKFQIIHSHVAVPDGFASMMINRDLNVPHIVTIHGQDFHLTINKDMNCRRSLFKVLNGVDYIVTVSSKLKDVIKEESFYEKTVVINNGVDLKDCEKTEVAADTDGKGFTLFSASSLIESKGIDLNIKAVSRLVKKYPDLRYYIAGDGPEEKSLKRIVNELKLENNVYFTGRLEHKDVMKYMACSDIFCLPSWEEGFGVVYIEAMAHGKPVIGVEGEGISDVIKNGENGFLVKPHDVESIVNTIDYLLRNADLSSEIGKNAKDTVSRNYTWTENVKKTISLYERAINNHCQ